MRKRKKKPAPQGSPLWMTTYSDLVTLLLCFFVLLYGISSVDEVKLEGLKSALKSGFGVFDGSESIVDIGAPMGDRVIPDQLSLLYASLDQFITDTGIEESVKLEMEERGLVVRFSDQIFFDLGKADLKTESLGILEKLAPLLREVPNPIRVEGHTDSLPIRTAKFPSNWELSSYRATSVIRYLVEEQEFSPERLSAAGYGEYRPVVDNDTERNRALNRRVDIIILNDDAWANEPK